MATKEYGMSSLSKRQHTFGNGNSSMDSDVQYRNFNLNRSHQNSSSMVVSKHPTNDAFKSNRNLTNNQDIKNDFHRTSKNKNDGLSSNPYANFKDAKDKNQNRWKSVSAAKTPTSSSTLSLHIAAYEDYVESENSDKDSEFLTFKKHCDSKKNWKNIKPLMNSKFQAATYQDDFEFPRQQNDNKQKPEVMQFNPFQRLLSVFTGPDKFQAVIDLACDLLDDESFVVLCIVLAKEDDKCGGRDKSGHWKMLADLVGRKEAFKNYAEKLVAQSRNDEADRFVKTASEIHKHLPSADENGILTILDQNRSYIGLLFPPGSKIYEQMSLTGRKKVIRVICLVAMNYNNTVAIFSTVVEEHLPKIQKLAKSGMIGSIILATLPVSYEILRSVWLWSKGKIDGARAAKNIVDAVTTTAAGYAGAFAGAALIGGLGGAFIGAIATGWVGNQFSKWLTSEIFNLSKNESLDKAYAYLGVSHRASNAEISEAFRKRLLIDHPDKGGSSEAFYKLQTYMALINADRGKT